MGRLGALQKLGWFGKACFKNGGGSVGWVRLNNGGGRVKRASKMEVGG